MSVLVNPWPVVPSWMHERPDDWLGDESRPDDRADDLSDRYQRDRKQLEDEAA